MGKKLTNEEVKEFVEKLGYKLISDYTNSLINLTIQDNDGYLYYICFPNLKSGRNPSKFHENNIYALYNIKLWIKYNNYELISEKITNTHDKLIIKDKEGYYYYSTLSNMLNSNPSKFNKSNPYTIKNIKHWCNLNKKPFELISDKYNGNKINLKWTCLNVECMEIFDATWDNIFQNKGCPFCCRNPQKVGISNCLVTKNPKLASEWHLTKNGSLTSYDVTVNSNKEIWWQCQDNPSHEWTAIISSRRINGCPYCAGFYPSEDYNLLVINPELCGEWDYEKNDKLPKEYVPNSGYKVWWICKECNHKWNAVISSRNYGGNGCPECSKSKGEKECKRVFDLINIYYISQKEFDGLIGLGGGNLSYDFYLPDKYNLLIEYQGEQHKRYIKGFHKSYNDFLKQVEHDRRKKEYAEQNNIRLLEIWYYDFDKVEEILENQLNKIADTLKQTLIQPEVTPEPVQPVTPVQ